MQERRKAAVKFPHPPVFGCCNVRGDSRGWECETRVHAELGSARGCVGEEF